MFLSLPGELNVQFTQQVLKDEKNIPNYRLVCTHWRNVIDGEFAKRLGPYRIHCPLGESPVTYLKLKSFAILFFKTILAPSDNDSTSLATLKSRIRNKLRQLPNILNIDNILKSDKLTLCPCKNHSPEDMIKHGKIGLAKFFLDGIDSHFKEKKMARSSQLLATVFLNHLGNLRMSIRRRNTEAVRYFIDRAVSKPKINIVKLEYAFKKCLKYGFPFEKRIFRVLLERDIFPLHTSKDFCHYLGHRGTEHKWIRICLFNVEVKVNMLRITAKVTFTADPSGVIRGVQSTTEKDFTELHQAVVDKDLETVSALTERGDNVNEEDHAKRTPVILAARSRSQQTFKLLIECNPNLSAKDSWGLTAMDWCVISGKPQWLRLLESRKPEKKLMDHAKDLFKDSTIKCQILKRERLPAFIHNLFNALANGDRE